VLEQVRRGGTGEPVGHVAVSTRPRASFVGPSIPYNG
jgi:hypothetical protein